MELKKYKLGELMDVKRGASLAGEHYATSGEYIRLTCGNFDYQNNSFKANTSKDNLYYTGPIREEFIMKKGDIITPLTEQAIGLLGSTAIIPEDGKYIQSQDIAKIICNEDLLCPSFAFYLISSDVVKKQLSAAAQQTKIRHTSPDKIKDCTVRIPDLPTQKKIGSVLSSLDRKIALNRSINRNLEALDKQLYDYWFVQFDFPNEEGKPYKSSGGKMVWNEKLKKEIPQGWNAKLLRDITKEDGIKQINPQQQPKKVFKHLSFLSLDTCGSYFEETGKDIKSNKTIVKSNYVLASKLNPWIKRIAWGTKDEDLICSTEFVVLNVSNSNTKAFLYEMLNQDSFIEYCTASSTGTSHSQRRVKPDIMKMYQFPYNERIAEMFGMQLLPLLEKSISALEQNKVLTKQRDELLPLLMNGQVSVK